MDKKTAGQVHFEHENSGYGLFWLEQDADTKARHERIAAAVITHVRPQIEAEARAVAIEDCAAVVRDHYWDSLTYEEIGKKHGEGIIKAMIAGRNV
jgi:hypothetical protein